MNRKNMNIKETLKKLEHTHIAEPQELLQIINDDSCDTQLFEAADRVRKSIYGNKVFIRGLIEISNYCKNNCYYCGIRCGNKNVERYRLTPDDILQCCKAGYALGFRTFVMQGGEDNYYTDNMLCDIIKQIKSDYSDCAVTLSLGERSKESYQRLYNAGADRYLLRHETASDKHYEMLHPTEMSFKNRIRCLMDLKEIGFQTGAGFMVGSPYQTRENLVNDLMFLKKLQPQMIGIGPFIPHRDTCFKNEKAGSLRDTLVMVALTRLLLPNALIPSTTALGTISENGRELGIKAGANVVMPNLSPVDLRKHYTLYNNKICMDTEAAEGLEALKMSMQNIGYEIVTDRGDYRA
ncbi:MAG: [FeFe] hydrogenase H-cluster radical SAM maturase HydE [Ruminococcus sp.]|nr:[FeFe] hydrogenase H-cluster radical SAM maturase HydE [Ruminococcus sp.]